MKLIAQGLLFLAMICMLIGVAAHWVTAAADCSRKGGTLLKDAWDLPVCVDMQKK